MSLTVPCCDSSSQDRDRPCEGILTLMRLLNTDDVKAETVISVENFCESEDCVLAITEVVVKIVSKLVAEVPERFSIEPGYGSVFISCKLCDFWFSFDVSPKLS